MTVTMTSPVFATRAEALWENAMAVAANFVDEPSDWIFGGSCWIWDARHPDPNGRWMLVLNRWAVSPFVVTFVTPAKVDKVRQSTEALVNAFPGTEERLLALGCDHVNLLHRTIDGLDDVVDWTWSIWNACVPNPKQAPDPYLYPHHVVSAGALGRSTFAVVPKNRRGIAVLPIEGGVRTFWESPSDRTA